jgi:chromate transport protein ChrA
MAKNASISEPAGRANEPRESELISSRNQVAFAEAFRFWVKLGFISFGGPAGQIAIMHRELVERRRWVSEERFLHALNYCMLLPGPEAQQLAIYIGWLLHRTPGGIIAGAFFVIPSVFILLALSYVYAAYGEVAAVAGVMAGFKPVVVAIVVEAALKIGRRALTRRAHYVIAATAFIRIYALRVPFPLIVLAAGLAGLAMAGRHTTPAGAETMKREPASVIDNDAPRPAHTLPSRRRALRTLAELAGELRLEAQAVRNLPDAVGKSDICVTCTPSRQPFLNQLDIAPGAFIVAVGADNEEKQELDPHLIAASKVVVDNLEQCAVIGDLKLALRAGLMTKADVHAELGQVIAGKRPGREAGEEVIVFDSTGTALQDVAAAAIVYEKGIDACRGITMDFNE